MQQAETLAPYGDRIVDDYGALHRRAPRCSRPPSGSPPRRRSRQTQQFLLLVGGLRTLADGSHAPGLVLDAFLLRSLAVAGYAAVVRGLRPLHAARAAPVLQRRRRAASSARACRPPGSVSPARETLDLLAALLTGDWVTADASELRHRREGSGLVAAYLQWHLERGLRSLPLVERT